MSAGLIYKYFGRKEDLLLATIVRIMDVFRDQLALKHWHFGPISTVDEYIRLQTRHLLNLLISDDRRADYPHLLG